MTHNNQVLQSL